MNDLSGTAVLFLSILAAVVPTLIYVLIIYWIDRYEKEPFWLLAAAFFWGAVPGILLAYFLNTLLGLPIYLATGGSALGETAVAALVAPFVEEGIKGAALVFIFLLWRDEIDSPLDGIIYGAIVGMGFAMVENAYYFVNQYNSGGAEAWLANIVARGIVFGLNHALFSSFTGLGIAVARMSTVSSTRVLAPIVGAGTAVFLHFWHNLTVYQGNAFILAALLFDWGGIVLILFIMLWALLQERRWLRQYLAEEVQLGTLTLRQYEVARSGRRRTAYNWQQLFSRGLRANRASVRFFLECSHLAYRKHHYRLFQDEKSAQAIEQTRARIRQMNL